MRILAIYENPEEYTVITDKTMPHKEGCEDTRIAIVVIDRKTGKTIREYTSISLGGFQDLKYKGEFKGVTKLGEKIPFEELAETDQKTVALVLL